jgi:hypothetical protein
MRKMLLPAAFAVLCATVACSNKATPTVAMAPSIAGAWEFTVESSTSTGSLTGVEVALQEGQTLVNNVNQPNGSISASGGTQITFVTLDPTNGSVVFGGSCPTAGDGTNSLSGSVTAPGGPFNFTYTESGNTFAVTATLSGDGASMLGTYESQAGSSCADSGTITGVKVSKLSGSYVGQLTLPDGTTDAVTAAVSESGGGVATVNLVATGVDNVAFTITGPVTGNAFLAQGTFQGQPVVYYGYAEPTLDPITQLMVPSIYFVNATNVDSAVYAGTLEKM